tara:strand:+ start:1085 stop:1858 length:774 start_codon:yes stop_codon:yes gene_type:complete
MPSAADIRAFWDSPDGVARSKTCDGGLRILEEHAIQSVVDKVVKPDQRILDAGCGTGSMAHVLALAHPYVVVEGIDQAAAMIHVAKDHKPLDNLVFTQGDLLDLKKRPARYDLVYTQRVLINFPTWQEQQKALRAIATALKPGGKYLMCESIQDALNTLNVVRRRVGLADIVPPETARYLRTDELAQMKVGLWDYQRDSFSSEYYFLSRVVNAWLAAREGKEPDYDAPVNQLSLDVPSGIVNGAIAQTQLWVWQKES